MQRVFHWKNAFKGLLPKLRHHVELVERCQRHYADHFRKLFDNTKLLRHTLSSAVYFAQYYDQIQAFRMLKNVNQAALDHIEAAIECRLTYLCDKLFQDSVKKEDFRLAVLISWSPRLDRFLPIPNSKIFTMEVPPPMPHSRYLPCCLPETSDDTLLPDVIKPTCFCSWAIHWLPVACLQCLDCDAQSFQRALHDTKHIFYNWGLELSVYYCEAAESSDDRFNTMSKIYRHAAVISMQIYFDWLSSAGRFEYIESFTRRLPQTVDLALVMIGALKAARDFLVSRPFQDIERRCVTRYMDTWVEHTRFDVAIEKELEKALK
jgi:hypothetical protein